MISDQVCHQTILPGILCAGGTNHEQSRDLGTTGSEAGKEKEVEEFLKSAQPLAEREPATLSWYAIKMGPGKYGIFDTFADENGRNAHLNGEIAKALFAKAKIFFPSRRRLPSRKFSP